MNKTKNKSQVLMISLWILVILTMLAVTIGHRVSLALKLSLYQKNEIQALYLAKAAVNLAISRIKSDDRSYDSLYDNWANDKAFFSQINLDEDSPGHAQVSYIINDGAEDETIYGAIDEERKININTATSEQLVALIKECGIDSATAESFAQNILVWRGAFPMIDETITNYYQNELGYPCKRKNLSLIQEISLIKGAQDIEEEKLNMLKSLITVYGDGKININTVSRHTLNILGNGAISELLKSGGAGSGINEEDALELTQALINFRSQKNNYFTTAAMNTEQIRSMIGLDDLATDNRTKVLNQLVVTGQFTTVSTHFMIEAHGFCGRTTKTATAVVKYENPLKIVYWHEK